MNGVNWKQKLTSRKLWAAIFAAMLMCVSAVFGEDMSAETVETLKTAAYVMMAYIFGEGFVDVAREIGTSKVDATQKLTDAWLNNVSGDGRDSVLK